MRRIALLLLLSLAACGGVSRAPETHTFWIDGKSVTLSRAEIESRLKTGALDEKSLVLSDGKWVLLSEYPPTAALLAEAKQPAVRGTQGRV